VETSWFFRTPVHENTVVSRTIGIVVLVVLFVFSAISLTAYLLYSIAVMLLPAVISAIYYRRSKLTGGSAPPQAGELKSVGKYFLTFCSPLVVYSVFSRFTTYSTAGSPSLRPVPNSRDTTRWAFGSPRSAR